MSKAKSLLDSSRALLSLAERLENADLVKRLQDLQRNMQEVIDENVTLRDERVGLKQEIDDLRRKLQHAEEMTFVKGLYHVINADNQIGEPYCPNCWEVDKTQVHIHWERISRGYICNNCEGRFSYSHRNSQLPSDTITD